jgi:hypothetical protein
MKNLTIKYVYQLLTEEEKRKIINLWVTSGVLSQHQALQRVEQVSCVILSNFEIVGVSTVYIDDFTTPHNPYFFFRMFIKQEYRGSNKLRTQVMQLNFQKLKEFHSKNSHGIAVELENEKLADLGAKTNYMKKRGYTYYGKSARGLQLWYVRFDDPKGIFFNNDLKEINEK